MSNWIFVNAWTQPSQNEVTSLMFVRKHFQDLAIEKTGWSYMYTGRKQSDWSLWTWNGHNYFSVNKTREHTDRAGAHSSEKFDKIQMVGNNVPEI